MQVLKALVKLSVISALFASLTTSFAFAKPKTYRLKMAMTWKGNTPILADTAKKAARLAEEMSNGRLKIRVDGSEKHKAPLGIFDLVRAGQYDIGHTASYYYKGKDFKTVFFTTVPFGMTASEQYSWYYNGGGKELAAKVYDKYNLATYMGGNTGMQMGGWFRKEINSAKDLQGLKFRIPGVGGEVMAKLGVNAVNIAPGELYMALDLGTIDAVEWVSPVFDTMLGFHKIAPYYYTGWQEPASELQFLVNKKTLNKLPKDLQAILENAFKAAAYDMVALANYKNAEIWASIKKDYPNVKIRTFPKDVIKKLQVATKEIFDAQAQKDPLFKEILHSQRDFLKKARAWTTVSEYTYLKNTVN